MTISDKLRYLGETKTLIKEAIQNKGVTVSDTDPFRTYADKISQIQTGGGSGGSGGEIIEAIVDESVLPIEADKKVVVADIQATGQGAGALMPFDIMPYSANNGTVNSLLQLRGEYSLHVNATNSSGPAHIGYKKAGNKWEGKYFANTFTGINKPNDAFNLLYDVVTYRYFAGSSGKYWNPIKEQEETITFDEPLTPSSIPNVTTRYFLTYDSKYLWAVHLNVSGISQSAANKGLICLYEITIDENTGEVFAHKKTEELEIEMLANAYQQCACSLNHYGIVVHVEKNASKMSYVQYNEAKNTLTVQTGASFWNGFRGYDLTAFTKDWVLLHAYYNYDQNRIYWGDFFTISFVSEDFGIGSHGWELARFGNTFYPLASYHDGIGSTSMTFIKMPVDKEHPAPDDFVFQSVTCYGSDRGPYMIDEENCLIGPGWEGDNTILIRTYNIPNNTMTDSDPNCIPIMLVDDGTGYFYEHTRDLLASIKINLIAPVEGSYNNGTVLKTIDPSIPFCQMINTASRDNGHGFHFGTLPMNYINGGEGFIFHNRAHVTTASEGVTFFKSTTDDPQIITRVSVNRGVRVSQNKAYITSYYNGTNDNTTYITVFDEKGRTDYTVNGDGYNLQGVYFEFEGETYSYPLPKRGVLYGRQDNRYLKFTFNADNLTCSYDILGTSELDYLNQMGQYVTSTDMAPSNTYPETGYNSLYSMPVITKDGKYFVGLAGNHTTHFAKIEKHESGYPMLNVYEFPQKLKDLLYEQEILYFEAYYPSGFGIQLANGTFLLCEYEQGLDVDLTITAYTPAHKYTPDSWNHCLMHFTSHKHYWYFSAGTYWNSNANTLGSIGGYAGCGRREDLPSMYQTKIYSMKYRSLGVDYVTGYLTGESYTDENGKLIAEVEVLRK